ncbi:MAG: hypothetical protein AAGF07_01340 [Patescibacteria group bacterium]
MMQQTGSYPSNQNGFNQVPPQGYNYNQNTYVTNTSRSGLFSLNKRINLLEIIVIVVCLISLLGISWWAFSSQNAVNRDRQRLQDISQVVNGLNEFYINSNTIPSQRAYPKAICSGSLNEVDFEFTLKRHLTGQVIELDTHKYIREEDFPRDNRGVYSTTFGEREIPYRCVEKLNSSKDINPQTQIYNDNTLSCNFSQASNLRKCYLYTSSTNGDLFRLGYWQESANRFVTYRKFRDEPLQVE